MALAPTELHMILLTYLRALTNAGARPEFPQIQVYLRINMHKSRAQIELALMHKRGA